MKELKDRAKTALRFSYFMAGVMLIYGVYLASEKNSKPELIFIALALLPSLHLALNQMKLIEIIEKLEEKKKESTEPEDREGL